MALGDYTKTTYVNGSPPGISADRLNNNENKTDELDDSLNTHTNNGAVNNNLAHGATSSATSYKIVARDLNGRAKVAAPAASDDIARKDTVDAKDPFNRYIYQTYFDSLDGFGGGYVAYSGVDKVPQISTVSGTVDVYKTITYPCAGLTWSKPRRFRAGINISDAANISSLYVIVGSPGISGNKFGFKITSSYIYGLTGNASNESTYPLDFTSNDFYILDAVFTPTSGVTFFINGVEFGVITTTLPSGSGLDAKVVLSMQLTTNGSSVTIQFSDWLFVQEP